MRKINGISIEDFERALDEYFDEMLIAPWREGPGPGGLAHSQVIDRGDYYEVRIAVPGVDPNRIGVEMIGEQLCVRAPAGRQGRIESTYSFAAPVNHGAVRARWARGVLVVSLPKLGPTRIKINYC
jgi:HSP20 family molecular chaperone IbpA